MDAKDFISYDDIKNRAENNQPSSEYLPVSDDETPFDN